MNGTIDVHEDLSTFILIMLTRIFGFQERLWRKSRQLNPDFGCVGADMNRNFDAFWGGEKLENND